MTHYALRFCLGLFASVFATASFAEDIAPDPLKLEPLTTQSDRSWLFQDKIAGPIRAETSTRTDVPGGSSYLPAKFNFPADVAVDNKLGIPRKNSIFGIDISHYSKDINFETLRSQGVRFVYVKATQGDHFMDKKFGMHWTSIANLSGDKKTLRGAYHFLSAGVDGKRQAAVFIAFLKQHGGFQPDDLPPVLDLEWDVSQQGGSDAWAVVDAHTIINTALDWLNYVKAETGREPVIYTAKSWVNERGLQQDFPQLERFRIWAADYSRSGLATETPAQPGTSVVQLWQFSEQAVVNASSSAPLDANLFLGNESEFQAFAKQ